MTASNDSTVVIRLSQELKSRLQEQAEQLDVSLSEIIRMKLMIAESAVHREPVIRLGDQQYRLWDLLRPDVLVYDLVDSGAQPADAVTYVEEPGRVDLPACGPATRPVEQAIAASRAAAIRHRCSEIAPVHLAIALMEQEGTNASIAVGRLAGGTVGVMRDLTAEATALAMHGALQSRRMRGNVPLTKEAATVLKRARREAKLRRRDVVDTTMVLLALLRDAEWTLPSMLAHGVTYAAVASTLQD